MRSTMGKHCTLQSNQSSEKKIPHVHFYILFTNSRLVPIQLSHLDKLISAEIASFRQLTLRDAVLKYKLPQPCGALSSTSVCMKEGHFSNPFPNKFVEENEQHERQFYPTEQKRHQSDISRAAP